jgi:hypothetical protein
VEHSSVVAPDDWQINSEHKKGVAITRIKHQAAAKLATSFRNVVAGGFLMSLCLFATAMTAQNVLAVSNPNAASSLRFDKPAARWLEAMPVGRHYTREFPGVRVIVRQPQQVTAQTGTELELQFAPSTPAGKVTIRMMSEK